MREKYNAEKEHEVVGLYPPIKGMELSGAKDENGESQIPPTPQFYRPIPVYENFKMLDDESDGRRQCGSRACG